MIRRPATPILCGLLMLSLITSALAANGGKAKNSLYQAFIQPASGSGEWRFTIDTSPIIFYLGTVNNKYHVLLIRVKNQTAVPLLLSKDQDTISLQFANGLSVKGFLNLPATDQPTWDGLDAEIRTAVVYPQVVPPGEEEGIYFYVPVEGVKAQRKAHAMPSTIILNIKSLPQPVELRTPGASKA